MRKGSSPGSSSRYRSSVPSGRLRASDLINDISAPIFVVKAETRPAISWYSGFVPSDERCREPYDATFVRRISRFSWASKHSSSTFGPSPSLPLKAVTEPTRSSTSLNSFSQSSLVGKISSSFHVSSSGTSARKICLLIIYPPDKDLILLLAISKTFEWFLEICENCS